MQMALSYIAEDVLTSIFCIYTSRPELDWLSKSWDTLSQLSLTSYDTAAEYNSVLGRLAFLAYIYHRWAEYAYQEDSSIEEQVENWHDLLPFVRESSISGLPESWKSVDDIPDNRKYSRMIDLIARESAVAFDALIKSYSDSAVYGLAIDLRHACTQPDEYSEYSEHYFEWQYGQKLFQETGMSPRELDALSALDQKFYLGC